MNARPLDWERSLEAAAEAARRAVAQARPHADDLARLLQDFDDDLNSSTSSVRDGIPENVREAVDGFDRRAATLRAGLDELLDDASRRLRESFQALSRDARFTTIMLFGRTKAGKSTTMEALTRGDGDSIGVGRQHTTTETKAYFYPPPPDGNAEPPGPALRIVDTPGIEGFEGEALGAMAEAFVERADHVLFLVSDDKASADELRRFGHIQTHGKAVTVVLNVKKTDGDLDLLGSDPEIVFDPAEIDGHRRRISGFLADHFGMEAPPVIPVHSRAAWLSRRPDKLPDDYAAELDPKDLPTLEHPSGIIDLEGRLHDFVRNGALAARLRAPSDLLHGYLESARSELRPYVRTFRDDRHALTSLRSTLDRALAAAEARAESSIRAFRPVYDLASASVEEFVDQRLSDRSGGSLGKHWHQFLRDHDLSDLARDFESAATAAFSEEVAEGVRAAAFDAAHIPSTGDAESLLESYHADAKAHSTKGYGRAALKTAGGVGGVALTAWGIANIWNPTGWAALAGASAASAVGGGVGAHAAKKASDAWSRADRLKLSARRAELLAALKKSLDEDHRQLVAGCGRWLDRTAATYREATADILRPVAATADGLRSRTLRLLHDLDALADRIDRDALAPLLSLECPEAANGEIQVVAVARSPGAACVVQVQSDLDNVIGRCIGAAGSRVESLRRHLSAERVTFVDANASMDEQIGQALGLRVPIQVCPSEADGHPLRVIVPSDHVGRAIGTDGVTVRLASRLFGTPISIDAA